MGSVSENTDTYEDNLQLDVLVVGAGFSGCYLLHRLRDELGLKVKVFEAASGIGGTWNWSRYPGARVDCQVPEWYMFSDPEIYSDFFWKEKFPGHAEMKRYFEHVDKKWKVSQDVAFNTRVIGAEFQEDKVAWNVNTQNGRTAYAHHLVLAVGVATSSYTPDWKGLKSFKGEMYHSWAWPEQGVDVKGKRVAVVGTGASGVQLIQEFGKEAAHLTAFHRTPNTCLPMRQRPLTAEEQEDRTSLTAAMLTRRKEFGGVAPTVHFTTTKLSEVSEEERDKAFEALWKEGGFAFWLGNFSDVLVEPSANRQAYDFWAKKVRERVHDARKRDLVAPLKPQHSFGAKRPSLEQDYYEIIDQDNVDLVDTRTNPISEFTEEGIITADGGLHKFDIIALATGYDMVTGVIKALKIKDENGLTISERWKDGISSYLGMTISGFPNMFYVYGAHGPNAFVNGPSLVELQGDWVVDTIAKLRKEGIKRISASKKSEESWSRMVKEAQSSTLLWSAESWYVGANIPGKAREPLFFLTGLPAYEQAAKDSLDNGFEGFDTRRAALL